MTPAQMCCVCGRVGTEMRTDASMGLLEDDEKPSDTGQRMLPEQLQLAVLQCIPKGDGALGQPTTLYSTGTSICPLPSDESVPKVPQQFRLPFSGAMSG